MSAATDSIPEVSLEVIGGPLDGLRFFGAQPEIRIGRRAGGRGSPLNDLVLKSSAFASGEHARVFWDDGRWYLADQGSQNGTSIRGKTLSGDTPPEELGGDEFFTIANTVIEFTTHPRRVPAPEAELPPASAATKKMIERARQRAAKMKSDYVGVKHLFCVLAESDVPIVPDVFAAAKLDPKEVARQTLEFDRWTGALEWIDRYIHQYEQPSSRNVQPKDLKETPRLQALWALAERTRQLSEAPSIEPMHLLAAILEEGGSTSVQVLRELGQDCSALAQTANRLAKHYFAPKEEKTAAKAKPETPRKPKAPARKRVDHGDWIRARELMDSLLAAQVQYQLADPTTRFDILRGKLREAFAQMPQPRREAVGEQLRLLFPLLEGKLELPDLPAAFSPPQSSAQESAAARDEATPTGRDAATTRSGNESELLKELFDTKNLGKTLGLTDDQAKTPFMRLAKIFYEFALGMEQLTKGVMQTLGGSGGGATLFTLPFVTHDLKIMIQKLLKEDDPDVVQAIDRYLKDLSHWVVALISSYENAADKWNKRVWETISPQTIKSECGISPALLKIGRGKADLWEIFEREARTLHPDIAADEFHQFVEAMTKNEFMKLSRGESKKG